MSEFLWIIVGIIVLGVLWGLTGGAQHTENVDKPFLEQPAPIEGGQPYTLEQLRDRNRP